MRRLPAPVCPRGPRLARDAELITQQLDLIVMTLHRVQLALHQASDGGGEGLLQRLAVASEGVVLAALGLALGAWLLAPAVPLALTVAAAAVSSRPKNLTATRVIRNVVERKIREGSRS
mgnify:CR=1 FL=1